MATYPYATSQHARSRSPARVHVEDEGASRDVDEQDPLAVPYIFGPTPSLRLDIPPPPPGPRTVPFPSAKPPLERRTSNVSSSSSSTSASPLSPPRPFELPPGLANSPLPSTLDVRSASRDRFRQARGAKISIEPPIPLEIQQLLLTTPPPPRRRYASSSLIPPPTYPPSKLADWKTAEDEEKPTLIKRIRALTMRNGSRKPELDVLVEPRAVMPKSEVLDLKRSPTHGDLLSFHSPQNWQEYEKYYAAGRLDVEAPPLPPNDSSLATSQTFPSARARIRTPLPFESMTPYDLAHFPAPLHLSRLSPIRERLISNLDLLGTFLPSENTLLSPQFSPALQSPDWSATASPLSSASSPTTRQDGSFRSMAWPGEVGRARGPSSASTAPSTIHSVSKTSHFGASPSYPYARSIQSHPALQGLLDAFASDSSATAATITLFPTSPATSYLSVLAATSAANSWREIGTDCALDAHTILNGSRGLVVNNVEKDWRWRGNRDIEEKGIAFYAGMPIFAPSSLSLRTSDVAFSVAQFEEEAGGGRIAIGVVAVMDDCPKESWMFGTAERARLRSIASEITSEIERFVLQRASAIEALSSRRTSATSAATFQSGTVSMPGPLRPARVDASTRSPPSPQRSRSGRGHVKKVSFDANALPAQAPTQPPPRIATPTFSEIDSVPPLFQSHSPQKMLDLACSSLARSLDLKLVYLVELGRLPPRPSVIGSSTPTLLLISSHGLPSSSSNEDSSANFDPMLHLQALRAPEGGLLYRAASSAEPFDSGMLLPVTELADTRKGWVIAGYAEEKGRRWGEEEMAIFENVTKGIQKILLWREEWK